MIKKYIPQPIRQFTYKHLFPVPLRLSKNFKQVNESGMALLEKSIKENFHTGWRSKDNYSEEKYLQDLASHLYTRLDADRREIIPWLDDATALQDKYILEIGCGTGSSTIAIAEQGAVVTGIDIDEGALIVAIERAKIYGVDAEFRVLNAKEISATFSASKFDIIIFFASLEHMTITERLSSLRDAWKMLPADGLLVIVETPNRLWYYDEHTSLLPFFHWLPDELAFAYSKFSTRENFHELYSTYDATSIEHFLRQGRGVSFHEFDVAIGSTRNLKIISSLSTFEGIKYTLKKSRQDRQYKSILMNIFPHIHEGFFDDLLYLIIQKE